MTINGKSVVGELRIGTRDCRMVGAHYLCFSGYFYINLEGIEGFGPFRDLRDGQGLAAVQRPDAGGEHTLEDCQMHLGKLCAQFYETIFD